MSLPSLFTRRRFLQCSSTALLGGAALGSYIYSVEPHWVEVVYRDLPIVDCPREWVGKRLVQLSDIHVGRAVADEYLLRSFELVANLGPDLLALTGDYMTCYRGEQVDHALSVLAHLPHGRLATLAALGNHDYGMPARDEKAANRLSAGLNDLGITVLRNEVQSVRGLTVAGLDDFWGPNFCPADVLTSLGEGQASLVLCHNPDVADLPIWGAYRGWVLSGHTHGGQCRPPFLGPPLLPVRNRRYVAGEFALPGGRRMYINRGLGHILHVRFNVRPEITVFTLARQTNLPAPPGNGRG